MTYNAESELWKLERRLMDIIPKRPLCRDCADEDGKCPTDGYSCDPIERAFEYIEHLKLI